MVTVLKLNMNHEYEPVFQDVQVRGDDCYQLDGAKRVGVMTLPYVPIIANYRPMPFDLPEVKIVITNSEGEMSVKQLVR